ncbi:ArsR/SmtB family transcription factor [Oceanobacillus arenosus]|uniref:ArsR/SmtB family transcription factor n=1 Tax=Oceanobacillus arenosus TaxID=1229153 RepID=UPI001B883ED1|nr:metalloregulator ArsR/SmtB family transcription factor [Oceanobacillus arenosus]
MTLLQALGDPVRQDIIIILASNGELNVGEITALTELSRPAVSHHLKILKESNIIRMDKMGKNNVYSLDAKDSLKKLKGLISEVENSCNS